MNWKKCKKLTIVWLQHELKYQYRMHRYGSRTSIVTKIYAGHPVMDEGQTNDWIADAITQGKPVMIGRLGGNECLNMTYWERHKMFPFRTDARADYLRDLCKGAGFFPNDLTYAKRFVDLMEESMHELDLIGKWDLYMEEYFIHEYAPNTEVTYLTGLEPWRLPKGSASRPWSEALKGKKVLVVHPFADTIQKQYAGSRTEIFSYFDSWDMLPEFELKTLKAVQSIAGTQTKYSDWFEALDDMIEQCSNIDFDVAIIGCGAYGFPLAARIKQMGKVAIHLGGATQLLFGIRGKRWDEDTARIYQDMVNDSWVRPSEAEVPENAKRVEGGCYW